MTPTFLPRTNRSFLPEQFAAEDAGFEYSPVNLVSDLFRETLGDPAPGTTLLYLTRRYGPSLWGADPEKDVTVYVLTTPDPDVLLGVGVHLSVGCLLLTRGLLRAECGPGGTAQARLKRALTPALRGLLIPVRIDTVPVGLHGVLKERLSAGQCAPHYHGAGHGVPLGWWRDPDRFSQRCPEEA